MALSRREFLRLGGVATAALTVTSCRAIGRELAQGALPANLPLPPSDLAARTEAEPLWRLLNRAGYGPRPGDLSRARDMGLAAYLDEQLNPDAIDDTAVDVMIAGLDTSRLDISGLISADEREVAADLMVATAMRAIYSQRQLHEAMVEFWSDHFNIYLRKARPQIALKMIDDREVIRVHALGNFGDMLLASAQSPAMLFYLDNVRNEASAPNENYARELMELHTLGVDSGYSQDDVQEVARAFTGWSIQPRRGTFRFYPALHDNRAKEILGHQLAAGGGQDDGFRVLEILLSHPATADFVATKLVRHFVADDPPADLVARVSRIFSESGGDIKSMLRAIFLSQEFANAAPKLKRPFRYVISALRGLGSDVADVRPLGRWLSLMGQVPFHWPAPDGYPDVADAWANNLLPRWRYGLNLASGIMPGVETPYEELVSAAGATSPPEILDAFAALLLGRPLDSTTQAAFLEYVGVGSLDNPLVQLRLRQAIGLMIASPDFQWA